MKPAQWLTRRTVAVYQQGSLGASTRQKRWSLLSQTFPDIAQMRVLDVGGDARAWLLGGVKPADLTLLNIGSVPDAPEPWMHGVAGDACDPPDHLHGFDLVFSNSVIEHVGGHLQRARYADFVRSAGRAYWMQTPYRYFPIEPHFLVPGLQYVPRKAQATIVSHWPIGNYASLTDRAVALDRVMAIELLSKAEISRYFPDATLIPERLGPLVKSWIAVRR